ncbi:hypothetical protein DTO96_100762 [Ephemeroptericola cinctiostellae]|uniref:Uncharacterized protein n=1 Tax=Ephemeroptericola cinctiostellae TaxID=2268024 RepID=A0A345D9K7_9BURK|nr:hypothetical protein [Ephemeroptericola cinctiostellae]AXF85045.1 hypothetical protein DTO96_100762 [Ephemeroptericola cinctiostellae]
MDVQNEIGYWSHWADMMPSGVPEALFLLFILFGLGFAFYLGWRQNEKEK